MTSVKTRDHFWALAGIGIAAVVALTIGLLAFTRASDDSARRREETVVRNGLRARIHEIESQIVPQTVWDDAVARLDNKFDGAWAHDNIGQFLTSVSHFAFSFVLGPDDRALYGMRDGKDVSLHAPSVELTEAKGVIARVRAAERARTGPPTLQSIVQSSSPKWVQGRLYVITATLVQPDFGHARIKQAAAPIVVTGREMDEQFMTSLSDRYLLTDLHLHDGDSRFEPTEAHAAIYDESGRDIATLDWTPQSQGGRLLTSILPWMLGLFALLLAATLGLYVRARRSAGRLLESEERTRHMAYHDALTGLSNRAHLEDMLQDAAAVEKSAGHGFALHLIDLDRFKDLNDTYGHHVGDEALKVVAERLRGLCATSGACARLGGDEFAVLQVNVDPESASAMAGRITRALEASFDLSVGMRIIGCSTGVALSDSECREPREMLRRADLALYRAKAEGRGCFRFFDLDMDRAYKTMRRLTEDLKADLAAGKLEMVYQPQVRLSGEVVGVEALARWTHATEGPISPTVFVPLAEEAGLINTLGAFTLRRAAEDSKLWPHVKTAVNVSATQLKDPGFVEQVRDIMRSADVDPSAIEIELTEGVLLSNEAHVHAALDALHEAEFSIALDDFGTGYSSLSYLPQFPIDKIKIDRSFVTALGHDRKADALFTAIVKLAEALDMRVIAEGVETTDQWLRLSAAGCTKIQGFIASRPLDAAAAVAFIQSATHHTDRGAKMPVDEAFPVLDDDRMIDHYSRSA